jgi:hypothetical protein
MITAPVSSSTRAPRPANATSASWQRPSTEAATVLLPNRGLQPTRSLYKSPGPRTAARRSAAGARRSASPAYQGPPRPQFIDCDGNAEEWPRRVATLRSLLRHPRLRHLCIWPNADQRIQLRLAGADTVQGGARHIDREQVPRADVGAQIGGQPISHAGCRPWRWASCALAHYALSTQRNVAAPTRTACLPATQTAWQPPELAVDANGGSFAFPATSITIQLTLARINQDWHACFRPSTANLGA